MNPPETELPDPFKRTTLSRLSLGDRHPGFEAGWLKLGTFPLEEEARKQITQIIHSIHRLTEASKRQKMNYDTYLQMSQLERPAGPLLISKNASRWGARKGLGVWPDREPPRAITKEDFFNTLPGEAMPETSFRIMRIDDDTNVASIEVVNQMAGTGALLVALVEKDAGPFYRKNIAKYLEAQITAENFRGYSTYFPLLDETSLRRINGPALEACLEGVTVYLREDLTAGALLVISRIPLETLFGGIFSSPMMVQ